MGANLRLSTIGKNGFELFDDVLGRPIALQHIQVFFTFIDAPPTVFPQGLQRVARHGMPFIHTIAHRVEVEQ
jgi:hypothetical protein